MAKQIVIREYVDSRTQREYATDQTFKSSKEARLQARQYNNDRREMETELEELNGEYPRRITRAVIYEV